METQSKTRVRVDHHQTQMKNDLTLSTKLGVQGVAMTLESAKRECENSESRLFQVKNDGNAVSKSAKEIYKLNFEPRAVDKLFQTDALQSLKDIYGDFGLFLPKNSYIFIGEGLSKTVTGLSIQGDDSNRCSFLVAGKANLIRKVRHQF